MKVLTKPLIVIALILLEGCGLNPSLEREKHVSHQAVTANVKSLPKVISVKVKQEKVPFYGILKTQVGTEASSIYYSGDAGVAGFLGQIFVHAAIANKAQESQLSKQQKAADKVLEDYQSYIEQVTYSSLLDSTANTIKLDHIRLNIIDSTSTITNGLIIESLPVFYISQDKTTIIIKHHLRATYASMPDQIVFENSSKIISPAIEINDGIDSWKYRNGEQFFATTKQLYHDSLNLLIQDMYQLLKSNEQEKTYKYYIGKEKHYIRGNMINNNCKNIILRGLQGNLVVLPVKNIKKCT